MRPSMVLNPSTGPKPIRGTSTPCPRSIRHVRVASARLPAQNPHSRLPPLGALLRGSVLHGKDRVQRAINHLPTQLGPSRTSGGDRFFRLSTTEEHGRLLGSALNVFVGVDTEAGKSNFVPPVSEEDGGYFVH